MNSNTTMTLVTLPAARRIHPVGHIPSTTPPTCLPRPQRRSFEPAEATTGDTSRFSDRGDSMVLGIRVRNAARFRRRRAILVVVATAVGLALWSLLAVLSHGLVPAAANGPIPPAAAAVHVVQPGDTLWSIATEVIGVSDEQVRPVVNQLASRTGGSALDVGQRVPLGGLEVS